MSIDPALLARYLAQTSELGGDVFLDSLTAREARRLVAAAVRGEKMVARADGDAGGEAAQPYTGEDPRDRYGVDSTARAGAASMTREQARAQLSAMFAPDAGGAMVADGEVSPVRTSVTASAASVGDASSAVASDTNALRGALAVLAADAHDCTRCRLSEGRTNVVFGEGAAHAEVVVVGEAPGQEEDRTGRPFVGRAGKLLDLLLMSAGYPRADVYICNVLKCRPPSNRNPLPDEVTACTTTWLHAQLESIAPKVVIAVGKFAAQTLCASEASVSRLRGRIHTYRGTPLIATYHPAYLLRSPEMVRVAWQDFQLLRKVHDEQA